MGGKNSTNQQKKDIKGNGLIKEIKQIDNSVQDLFSSRIINGPSVNSSAAKLADFKLETISDEVYEEVEEKIEEMAGFKSYYAMKIKLNDVQKPIDGTYYQFNKGCIFTAC